MPKPPKVSKPGIGRPKTGNSARKTTYNSQHKMREGMPRVSDAKNAGVKKGWVNPNPVTPTLRDDGVWVNKDNRPICGANRTGKSSSGPGVCCKPAGQGTDHLGYGHCWLHLGSTLQHTRDAVMEQVVDRAINVYGQAVTIAPADALMLDLYRTQGHVDWLFAQIQALGEDPNAAIQKGVFGVKPHHWIEWYQTERTHLLAVVKTAISLGIAEKQVQIAQEQGRMLATVLQAFTMDPDLNLTPEQRMKVPELLRKHLSALTVTAAALPPAMELT